VTQDPAKVRCLIENAIDERIEQFAPLTPNPSPPATGGEGRQKLRGVDGSRFDE
jgi:hypothetical protein